MHSQWGFLLPIQMGCKPIFIKTEDFGMRPLNHSHFSLPSEEETVRLFLNAVRGEGDDPTVYLSRDFAASIDIREIRNYFGPLSCYTRLQRLDTPLPGKQKKTNSILVMDENTIIHLHMRWEPGAGLWKIYGIEKE